MGAVSILFFVTGLSPSASDIPSHLRALDPLGSEVYSQWMPIYTEDAESTSGLVYFEAIPTQGVAHLQFSYGDLSQDVDLDPDNLGGIPDAPCRTVSCLHPCDLEEVPGVCSPLPPYCDSVPSNVPTVCDHPALVPCEQFVVKDNPPCAPVPPFNPCPEGAVNCLCDSLALMDSALVPCGGDDCLPAAECLPCDPSGLLNPASTSVSSSEPCSVTVCDGGGTSCLTDEVPCGLAGKPSCQDYLCKGDTCDPEVCDDGSLDCVLCEHQLGQASTSSVTSCLPTVCQGPVANCVPDPCDGSVFSASASIDCIDLPDVPRVCDGPCVPECAQINQVQLSLVPDCLSDYISGANLQPCAPPSCYEIDLPLTAQPTASSRAEDYCQADIQVDTMRSPELHEEQNRTDASGRPLYGKMNYTAIAWGAQIRYENLCNARSNGTASYVVGVQWSGPRWGQTGSPFPIFSDVRYRGAEIECDQYASRANAFSTCNNNAEHHLWVRPDTQAYVWYPAPTTDDEAALDARVRFGGVNVTMNGQFKGTQGCEPRTQNLAYAFDAATLLIGGLPMKIAQGVFVGSAGNFLGGILHKEACKFTRWQPWTFDVPDGDHSKRIGNGVLMGPKYEGGISINKQIEAQAEVDMTIGACVSRGYDLQTGNRAQWDISVSTDGAGSGPYDSSHGRESDGMWTWQHLNMLCIRTAKDPPQT